MPEMVKQMACDSRLSSSSLWVGAEAVIALVLVSACVQFIRRSLSTSEAVDGTKKGFNLVLGHSSHCQSSLADGSNRKVSRFVSLEKNPLYFQSNCEAALVVYLEQSSGVQLY